jgi:hypothetical protein
MNYKRRGHSRGKLFVTVWLDIYQQCRNNLCAGDGDCTARRDTSRGRPAAGRPLQPALREPAQQRRTLPPRRPQEARLGGGGQARTGSSYPS